MKLKLETGIIENLINQEFKTELLETKNKIDQYYAIKTTLPNGYVSSKWEEYRSLLNKYETIPKGKRKLNRAYFKLKEIVVDNKKVMDKIQKAACLAEGPGGFIQFLTDFYPDLEVFGITLKYASESAAKNRHMKNFNDKNIKIIYGDPNNPYHDGDLYKKDVVEAFSNQVGKVDLVTADGGFEAKNDNDKEVEHIKLFLAETLTAFRILNKGGHFILKIYDIFTRPTLEMLFLLSKNFKKVELVKPVSSRPANSERYVVCTGFKGKPIEEHVDEKDKYSSILDLSDKDKKDFELFIHNLEEQNKIYVERVIKNINDVVDFISEHDDNSAAKINKQQEQEIYKEVWEKVYEKRDRKRARQEKKKK